MSKGPGHFVDIGKKAKDLLTKDYNADQKISISTYSGAGVMSSNITGGKAGFLKASSSNSIDAGPTPVKFSNDAWRLQQINSIRKAPVGSQIKRVIDLLLEHRQSLTPEEINEACSVDINANRAIFNTLRNNPKVSYDGKRFSYKTKHDVKDKSQLLVLIRKFPEGIAVVDLKDAYLTVMEDLQALKAEGQIWMLSNFDSAEEAAYPNDPRVPIKVDDVFKQLFRETELPEMDNYEDCLRKCGIKPSVNTAKRMAASRIEDISSEKKSKERGFNKRSKYTNVHLMHLLQLRETS